MMQGQRIHETQQDTKRGECSLKNVQSCTYFALFDGYIPLTTELIQLFANTFPFLQQGTNICMINLQNFDYHSYIIQDV